MSQIPVSQSSEISIKLPPDEIVIRDMCFHFSGPFEPFPLDDVNAPVSASNIAHSQRPYVAQTQLAQLKTEVENLT